MTGFDKSLDKYRDGKAAPIVRHRWLCKWERILKKEKVEVEGH